MIAFITGFFGLMFTLIYLSLKFIFWGFIITIGLFSIGTLLNVFLMIFTGFKHKP